MEEHEQRMRAEGDLMTRNPPEANDGRGGRDLVLPAGLFSLACRRVAQPHTLRQFARLAGEGTGSLRRLWTQARNEREIRRRLDGGTDVTFIASFFRSGNTWLRFLLTDILLQNRGAQTSTADSGRVGELAPDIYCDLIAGRREPDGEPLLVKSHETFDGIRRVATGGGRRAGGDSRKGRVKYLYLYRKPEDALVSYYHFRLLEAPVLGRWMELEPFCRAEFPRWIEHVSSFLQARGEGAEVLFVSYESLLRETAASLGAILRWLDIGHTEANLLRAVNNMAFAKLRRLEEVRRKDAREYFFRKGREGSGPEELSAEPVRRIRDGAALVMARAEEEAARSRPQAAAPEKLNSAAAPGPGAGRCAPSPAARSAAAGFPACRGESG